MRRSALLGLVAVVLGGLGGSTGRTAVAPTFATFVAPAPLGRDAGEPSIGANWSTGNVMFQAGLETLRVAGFDSATGNATWTSVGSQITSTVSLDPILFTDSATGRTFVSQLTAACSLLAFTDDDGARWTQNPIGCGVAAAADHQTVGGGAFAPGATGVGARYAHAVYYCAQAIATAECSLSNTGGLTFNPGTPLYTILQCGGLHGHVAVAPEGTAYVPNADCGGQIAVAASTDNGTTWAVRKIPGSTTTDESDPGVAVGAGGSVYVGWENGDGHAYAAVSHDRGRTWVNVRDVGAAQGIVNTKFPTLVAGDDDRAAFAFLGTKTAGDDQSGKFTGVWHLYVATTYDGGGSWTVVDATPTDPVQRGCIWMAGGTNQCRNLLDFMGATVDKMGRVLVGYADGCTGSCVTGGTNTWSSLGTIARQSGGTGLFAAYDGQITS